MRAVRIIFLASDNAILRSHVDSHHAPPPSQGGMQISYTLRAKWRSWRDSHPLVLRVESATARRLCAQERRKKGGLPPVGEPGLTTEGGASYRSAEDATWQ